MDIPQVAQYSGILRATFLSGKRSNRLSYRPRGDVQPRCYLLGPCKPQVLLISRMCSHLTHQELIRNSSGRPLRAILMSSYTAETVHGLDRASSSLPSPPQTSLAGPLSGRHPRAVRRHLPQPQGGRDRPQADRTGPPSPRGGAHRRRRRHQGADLFGDYVEKVWWPAWKAQHPDSAYQTGKRIEKRILPFFGNTPFAALDADQIGTWKASLVAAGLRPSSVNSYLSLLGTILNAAVDSEYLSRSPLMRRSRAGRVAAAKNLPVSRARYGSPAASSTASAKRSVPATRPSSRWPR